MIYILCFNTFVVYKITAQIVISLEIEVTKIISHHDYQQICVISDGSSFSFLLSVDYQYKGQLNKLFLYNFLQIFSTEGNPNKLLFMITHIPMACACSTSAQNK